MSDIFEIRFDTNAEETTRKLDKLEKETKELARAMKGLPPATNKAKKGVDDLGNAAQISGKKMNRGTVAAQQFGYQIGDFAVQVQGGTNALLALGQQGTQLLGIFGAGGAIAGAALAITTALVAPLMRSSAEADRTTESIISLGDAISDINDMTLESIIDQFGGLTESVKSALLVSNQFLLTQLKIDLQQSKKDVAKAGKEIALSQYLNDAELDSLPAALAIGPFKWAQLVDQAIGTGMMGTHIPNAALSDDLQQFARYADEQEMRDMFDDVMKTYDFTDPDNKAGFEIAKQIGSYLEALNARDQAIRDSDQVRLALEKGEAPGGSTRKDRMADNAARDFEALINEGIRTSDRIRREKEREDARRARMGESAYKKEQADITRGWKNFDRLLQKTVGKANRELEAAAKQRDREKKAIEDSVLTQEERILATMEEARVLGVSEEALTRLNKKLEEARVNANFFATTLGNELNRAFGAVITGASSTKDAMLDMIKSILQATAQNTFKTGVTDVLTAGLSSLAGSAGASINSYFNPGSVQSSPTPVKRPDRNALGGVYGYGGRISAYAKGGVVSGATMFSHGGGLGLMGEAGPEAIMPLKRGANGSLGVVSQGGGSTPVVVNIKNESGGEVQTNQGPNGLDIIIGAVSRDIAAGGKTFNTIRKTFNITPGIQRRA